MRQYRKPYRVKKKKSILKKHFFWLGILIFLIFSSFFYLICFSALFQIKEIEIFGNQKVAVDDIREVIEKEIEKKILFLSTKSIFLVNFSQIETKILGRFLQIAKINLKQKFPNILIAIVEERKPVAIFNQEDLYFFLDREGIIFENALAEDQLIKIKKVEKFEDLKLGQRVLEKELLLSILEVVSKVENDFKIPLEEVLIISGERINLKTFENWEIYLNPQEEINWQLTKLKVVLEKEIPLEKRGNLQYIELRFGNFASYKYRK